MAISTRIAPMYGGQKIFAALLFAVFGLWGLYDFAVKIPNQQRLFDRHEAAVNQRGVLIDQLQKQGFLEEDEERLLLAAEQEIAQLAPGGVVPVKPSKFNRLTQVIYMTCIPFAPWFFVAFLKAKRQKYTLDDDGTLHFAGDPEHKSGEWKQEEIVDMDMEKWMAKSIAYAVHADGRRLKLDAYLHKDLHLIIGAIAHRFYPDLWELDGKMVKRDEEEPIGEAVLEDDVDGASATVPERV